MYRFSKWQARHGWISSEMAEPEGTAMISLNVSEEDASLEESSVSENISLNWCQAVSRQCIRFRKINMVLFMTSLTCLMITLYPMLSIFKSEQTDCHFIRIPGHCMLPFPSDFFLENPSSSTGERKMSLKGQSLPRLRFGRKWNVHWWNEGPMDGFSRLSPIIFSLYNMNKDSLPRYDEIDWVSREDSATILLDSVTGEEVAHFLSSDSFFDDTDPYAAVAIHPALPLKEGHLYLFGVRNIRDRTNISSLAAVPKGFQVIRDNSTFVDEVGTIFRNQNYSSLKQKYERDIFPILDQHGFKRYQLQLAWDFTVKSKNSTIHWANNMQSVLDDYWLSNNETKNKAAFQIDNVENEVCDASIQKGWYRKIHGHVQNVPLFLENDRPGSKLSYPIKQRGLAKISFSIFIPCSLSFLDIPQASMLLQYGHGLMGSQGEAQNGKLRFLCTYLKTDEDVFFTKDYLERIANDYHVVLWAVDWRGMSQYDILAVFKMLLVEPDQFGILPHNILQGLSDATFVLFTLLSDDFREHEVMQIDKKPIFPRVNESLKKNSLVDIPIGYYGNSQGGILGAALLGFSSLYSCGVLGVGGAPYSLLISKSIDARPYIEALQLQLTYRDIPLYASLIQQLWDIGEPAGWLSTILEDNKYVLLHAAIQDRQVPIEGAEVLARGLQVEYIGNYGRNVVGLKRETRPWLYPHSRFVEWNISAEANYPPHECVRRIKEQVQQTMEFLYSNGYVFDSFPDITNTYVQTCSYH
eukprot:jgi/Galph1/4255/GphlegSOOS_G2932.1